MRQARLQRRAQPVRQIHRLRRLFSARRRSVRQDSAGHFRCRSWLRATVDYDGRTLKGLSGAIVGPLLGKDGKPLLADVERDSEGMALIERTPKKGTAYISFERHHRIDRYPFDGESFGPPSGSISLPAGTKRMSINSGLEALALIPTGKLKGTGRLCREPNGQER
ncbi:MAG: esterase-like activity of phytase family protein [Methyloceanibacter sp.]